MNIIKYKISKDKKGLLGYFRTNHKLNYYHIHSNELTQLEKWTKKLLEDK